MRFGTQDKDFFPGELTDKFRFAREMGFTCFEVDGSWLLNRYQDHMLNTMEDAVNIIRKGGFRRVKTTYDFYHMAIEEDDMKETLRKYRREIGHIHIAENHRYQPGTGSINWAGLMGALKELGYEGAVVNEGRIRGDDPCEAYRESVRFMRQFI